MLFRSSQVLLCLAASRCAAAVRGDCVLSRGCQAISSRDLGRLGMGCVGSVTTRSVKRRRRGGYDDWAEERGLGRDRMYGGSYWWSNADYPAITREANSLTLITPPRGHPVPNPKTLHRLAVQPHLVTARRNRATFPHYPDALLFIAIW